MMSARRRSNTVAANDSTSPSSHEVRITGVID
jgi:hypothetical protein